MLSKIYSYRLGFSAILPTGLELIQSYILYLKICVIECYEALVVTYDNMLHETLHNFFCFLTTRYR